MGDVEDEDKCMMHERCVVMCVNEGEGVGVGGIGKSLHLILIFNNKLY